MSGYLILCNNQKESFLGDFWDPDNQNAGLVEKWTPHILWDCPLNLLSFCHIVMFLTRSNSEVAICAVKKWMKAWTIKKEVRTNNF
jgi:hypothetical protein